PALTRVDVATGEISEIELPDGYEGEESVRDINLIEGLLFARISPINDVIVYDLAEEKWIDTIENVVGLEAAPAVRTNYSGEERTEVLLPQVGGDTVGFDLETQEQHEVPFDLGGAGARGWALQEFELDGFPGESLVTATSSATFFIWNPQTGQTHRTDSEAAGTPFQIRSLAKGPNGDIWVGGYLSPPGVALVDAESGAHEQLPASGQVEGMISHNHHLVVGTYPGARLRAFDTQKPWDFGANPDDGVVIGNGQDRPVAYASSGEEVVVGSVPDYGQLGGGITVFDPETGDLDFVDEPIENQTVLSLAYHDGMFYGGTGIWGGLGTEPVTSEGRIFTFNPATHEVTDYGVAVPGEPNVSG